MEGKVENVGPLLRGKAGESRAEIFCVVHSFDMAAVDDELV